MEDLLGEYFDKIEKQYLSEESDRQKEIRLAKEKAEKRNIKIEQILKTNI